MHVVERFAAWAVDFRNTALPHEVRHHARRAVIDWHAALLPGTVVPPATLLKQAFAAEPTSVLQRIDQLALEIHGVSQQKYLDVVRRLKEHFHLVNVHYNNYECMPRLDPLPSRIVELLFVNKRVADAAGPKPRGPHPLDTPSNRKVPDCQTPTSRWHFGDLRHVPTLFR